MDDQHTSIEELDVDEAWLREWAAEGLRDLERHLARQAAFAAYLQARAAVESAYGDGGPAD
jgi:hypothetical protein